MAYLRPRVGRVGVAEHGQAEGRGLAGAGLRLGDQVLRPGEKRGQAVSRVRDAAGGGGNGLTGAPTSGAGRSPGSLKVG